MVSKEFLDEVLRSNGELSDFEKIDKIEGLEVFETDLEYRTDVITCPVSGSYIKPDQKINLYQLKLLY